MSNENLDSDEPNDQWEQSELEKFTNKKAPPLEINLIAVDSLPPIGVTVELHFNDGHSFLAERQLCENDKTQWGWVYQSRLTGVEYLPPDYPMIKGWNLLKSSD